MCLKNAAYFYLYRMLRISCANRSRNEEVDETSKGLIIKNAKNVESNLIEKAVAYDIQIINNIPQVFQSHLCSNKDLEI